MSGATPELIKVAVANLRTKSRVSCPEITCEEAEQLANLIEALADGMCWRCGKELDAEEVDTKTLTLPFNAGG